MLFFLQSSICLVLTVEVRLNMLCYYHNFVVHRNNVSVCCEQVRPMYMYFGDYTDTSNVRIKPELKFVPR